MSTIAVTVGGSTINITTEAQGPAWSAGIIWRGAYSGATAYVVNDGVSYNGSSYICILASTWNLPTNGTYWEIIASKWDTGATWATWSQWIQGIQWETWATGAAGPNTVTTSTTTNITGLFKWNWSTVSAAAAWVDYAAALWADDNYVTDAEKVIIGNTSGTNSGNETATSIGALIGWAGDATPNNTDYVATSLTAGGILKRITWTNVKAFLKTYFDTLYPSWSGTSTGTNTGDQDLSWLVTKATYDAHTVLYATTDNTPVALTVWEQTIVWRATGGNISAIAIDSDLASVSANDDTVPSAKATKAMGDLKLPLAWGTMSWPIILWENTSIALDPAGSADGKYTGITVTGTAGATLAFWDVIVLDVTASKWLLADANSAASADGDARGLIGMCVLAANDTQSTTILLQGIIRADANFPALTITAPVYLSETAWDIVVAQPVTTDVVIRVLGFALTDSEIYFNPSSDYITHI